MAERSSEQPSGPGAHGTAPSSIQLINVLVAREGETVSSKWGIHPQLKQELDPSEWQELSEHMNRVTAIVGAKFAQQLSQDEGNAPGHGTA
jgi:hypothetical protein